MTEDPAQAAPLLDRLMPAFPGSISILSFPADRKELGSCTALTT